MTKKINLFVSLKDPSLIDMEGEVEHAVEATSHNDELKSLPPKM
jgi:hypothetical protein